MIKKRLNLLLCGLLLVGCVSNSDLDLDSNEQVYHFQNTNFNEILNNGSYNFSANVGGLFSKIPIRNINIVNRNIEDKKLTLQLNTAGKVYVNSNVINLSNKLFHISTDNNLIVVSDENSNFQVHYDTQNKKSYIVQGNKIMSFDELKESDIKGNVLYYPIIISLIEMLFFQSGESISYNVNTNYSIKGKDSSDRHEGTALGFHKDRSSANMLCNRDHQKILNENKSWCSGGVSISCVWDNHLCICTAEYYSGEECTKGFK